MESEFQMSMMGELTFFFGLQNKQCKKCTFIHQAKYTKDLLKKFNMVNVKSLFIPMSTTMTLDPDEDYEAVEQREYKSMIGSLLYMMVTRPDIHFGVCLCARFQTSPRVTHRKAVKRIFRYLKYILEFGLWYSASSSLDLIGYSDADFVGCRIDRNNTSGTCHFLGTSLICWSSHKQSSVAQSTIEVEYVAVASYCSQILWIVSIMRDYRLTFKSVPLMCDNSSVICLAKNPIQHGKVKHINV
ncbi:hypothetical protein QOZ80_2BG0177540 [Eleusine coracana subsp. coracana]|nr:hypothetical protein QOZ80_2BG0177540 [Eleusine coracana subsp. coracana]